MIIDGHADISAFLVQESAKGNGFALEEHVLPHLQTGGITGVVNAVYLSPEEKETPKQSALEQIGELKRQVSESQQMELVHSARELESAYKRDLIGVYLSLEGAEPIESLDDLDDFYNEGVRFVGLTWNVANQYSGGCATQQFGLSDLGYELLERMSHKNMILDVSHLSDKATNQAIETYQGLLIASHSNAKSYSDHVRNLSDEQLRGIAERGGVVGINVISDFAAESFASPEDIRRQIDYVLHQCGEDHVAFGFDFCDRYFPGMDRKTHDLLTGPEEAFDFLQSLRLPERIKDKIAWQNWLRIHETLND